MAKKAAVKANPLPLGLPEIYDIINSLPKE